MKTYRTEQHRGSHFKFEREQWDTEVIRATLLADIRDTLIEIRDVLRARLNCFETLGIPGSLRQIEKNTRPKPRRRKKR